MSSILLSIIIPFRASDDRPYLLERLETISEFLDRVDNVEIILVDSGSPKSFTNRIKEICYQVGFHYLYHNSKNKIYSIGVVRDYGVQHAHGESVTFLDVDLSPVPRFSQRVIGLAKRTGVMNTAEQFYVIPCLYLREKGNAAFLEEDANDRHKIFLQKYLYGEKEYVQNLAPCSSVIIINRHHYLSIGGHRTEFEGHGYEDFELIHRLTSIQNILPRAKYYYYDSKSWDDTMYEGFRAQFSLLGRQALVEGLFTVHLWHPRPNTSGYEGNHAKNHKNAIKYFKHFDTNGLNPLPLVDLTRKDEGKTLFIGAAFSNAAECIRQALPYMGEIVYARENDILGNQFDKERLEEYIRINKINLIIFPNPYANQIRHSIYNWTRSNDFLYYCFDRGALPNSWFFDSNGFNVDSASYSSDRWDKDLPQEEKAAVNKYINKLLEGDSHLEKQGPKENFISLKKSLDIGTNKVLFVPFQRPNDTVVKHFSDVAVSVDNFAKIIDSIAKELLEHDWVVVCKKHPLEIDKPRLKYAKWAPNDTHFMSLLELSSAVALINSGVGIYAAIMGKPCFIFGEAFYQHPQVNTKINDLSTAVELILSHKQVNEVIVHRFIYHLLTRVYSFGRSKTHTFYEKNNSRKTVTTGISFYSLNVPGRINLRYSEHSLRKIPKDAPLFEPFLNDILKSKGRFPQILDSLISIISPYSMGLLVFRIISRPFMNINQAAKLKRNPSAFFRDSKSSRVRKVGSILRVVT